MFDDYQIRIQDHILLNSLLFKGYNKYIIISPPETPVDQHPGLQYGPPPVVPEPPSKPVVSDPPGFPASPRNLVIQERSRVTLKVAQSHSIPTDAPIEGHKPPEILNKLESPPETPVDQHPGLQYGPPPVVPEPPSKPVVSDPPGFPASPRNLVIQERSRVTLKVAQSHSIPTDAPIEGHKPPEILNKLESPPETPVDQHPGLQYGPPPVVPEPPSKPVVSDPPGFPASPRNLVRKVESHLESRPVSLHPNRRSH